MSDSAIPSLESWVDAINAALSTAFAVEEPGKLFLEFEGDLRVGVDFPDGAAAYDIYAPIGLLNSAGELSRLLVALQLNLYQRGTAGGVIGLDAMSGAFIYSFSFLVEHSSPEIMARQIDHFVAHARHLRERLEQAAGDVNSSELEELAADLGLVREDEVEDYEAREQIEEPPPRPEQMIRV